MIVACDGSDDGTAGAGPRGRRRRRARAAARRQGPRAGRRRRGRATRERDRRVLRRQRAVGARARCARLVAPFADPRVGYVCGQVGFSTRAARTRRASTGATRCALRALESRPGIGDGRQRRDLRDPPRGLPRRRPDHGARPLAFPFNMVKRGWRAVYAPAARASEQMVPTRRGRVRPQAADDEPRLADRAARRDALAARLPAALRADDRLATACCATRRRSCTSPRSPRASRWSRSARARSTSSPSRSRSALLAAAALGAAVRVRAAARRPLLRADHGLARRRAVGLAAPRHAGGLGAAGRDALMARRALDLLVGGRRDACSPLRSSRSRPRPIRLESPGAPALYRQRRVGRDGAEFEIVKLRTMVPGAERHRRGPRRRRRATRASPASARSCAGPRSTSCRTCGTSLRGEMSIVGPRPTVPSQVAAVHAAPAGAARRQAGDHGLGAGQRPRRAAVVRAHRARPLLRRARARSRSTCGSSPARPGWCWAGTASTRARPGGGGAEAAAAPRPRAARHPADRRRQALRHRQRASRATRRVVAADPSAARARRSTPPTFAPRSRASTTPPTCRRSRELCDAPRRRRGDAAHRPRHRGAGARPCRGRPARARARSRGRRARPTTSTRPTCCSGGSALPSPPTVLPGRAGRDATR